MLRPRSGRGSLICRKRASFAGEKAPIEQADGEFGVGGIDLVALDGRVYGLADAESAIPQIAQAQGQGLFDCGLGLFIRSDDQQIDIGKGEELPSSVPAHRDDCDLRRHGLPPRADNLIHQRSALLKHRGGVACAEKFFFDAGFAHFR